MYTLYVYSVLIQPNIEVNNTTKDFLLNFKYFGISFAIGIISDFWTLSTLHIYSFYRLSARIYWLYCVLMLSLFRLFRGKKWNVLRNRVDQTDYTMDQLLVGMLLFSILFCTFPTITAYYWLFTSAFLFVLTIKCILESITIILNSFPIYFLFLKFCKNPILTERFRLIPFELKTKVPSFILSLDCPSFSEIFSELVDELVDCWLKVFNLKNLYKLIVCRPIS